MAATPTVGQAMSVRSWRAVSAGIVAFGSTATLSRYCRYRARRAVDAGAARARAPRVELGPVGPRRSARDAKPHRLRCGAAWPRRDPHRSLVLAGDPVRRNVTAVG